MHKDVIGAIDGVSLFPVIAIIIFTLFFAIVFIYAMRMDKSRVELLSDIPLRDDPTPSLTTTNTQIDRS